MSHLCPKNGFGPHDPAVPVLCFIAGVISSHSVPDKEVHRSVKIPLVCCDFPNL